MQRSNYGGGPVPLSRRRDRWEIHRMKQIQLMQQINSMQHLMSGKGQASKREEIRPRRQHPGSGHSPSFRGLAARAVQLLGVVATAILLLPTGVLILAISLIQSLTRAAAAGVEPKGESS